MINRDKCERDVHDEDEWREDQDWRVGAVGGFVDAGRVGGYVKLGPCIDNIIGFDCGSCVAASQVVSSSSSSCQHRHKQEKTTGPGRRDKSNFDPRTYIQDTRHNKLQESGQW